MAMATLTIRNLDDHVKQELRKRAAVRGVSMEQEARDVLTLGIESPPVRRRKPRLEVLTRLGIKPDKPVDLKKLSDEMWDEGLL
jgi:plasmid stability protein